MSYAEKTTVPVEKSRAEIELILSRYGADQFGYAQDRNRGLASIQFRACGRHIRFVLELPQTDEERFRKTPSRGRQRSCESAHRAWEQECRRKWRALSLCIKAKLEAVESDISEFEEEFLAHIVLPGDISVSQLVRPQIEKAYATGDLPAGITALLPAPKKSDN